MKSILSLLLCLCAMASQLYAAESDGELRVGYANRTFNTHFGEYNPNWIATGSSVNHLWSDFSMNGVNVEYLNRLNVLDSQMLKWGVGAELLTGTNNYEYSVAKTGSASATAIDLKAFVEAAYPLSNQLSVTGDLGVSLAYLFSGAGSPATGPVSAAYTIGFPSVYANIGGKYALDSQSGVSVSYRFSVAGLGAWTDTYFTSGMYEINNTASGLYINYYFKF